MPEGPSIVILKEELDAFKGKKVLEANGNSKIDIQSLINKKITDIKSWGKHLLICFDNMYLRIHLLMFGSYRINEKKDTTPRLSMKFKAGEINFYNCSIKLIPGDPDDTYKWETDVMSDQWNSKIAEKKLATLKKVKVCDVLLNQETFSGVGNIIKNEVLFRIKVHPESYVSALSPKKLKDLVKEAREYSWDFYKWKKKFELRKHWLIYRQKECPRCKIKTITEYMGKTNRLTCYCSNCQKLYSTIKK
ncbi:MAG: endonuclease [Bacteroidetes bacterium]|nr:endonuclease [Bacteroidota bacterium]